jgi:hypothetical protein
MNASRVVECLKACLEVAPANFFEARYNNYLRERGFLVAMMGTVI